MENNKKIKAVYFKQKGEAQEVLNFGEQTLLTPSHDEVRVKLIASPINPADFMFIEKKYRLEPIFPQTAGFEGVGEVMENGGDTSFPLGSRVSFRYKNVWAEYINLPKDKLIPLPKDISIEKAAQLSLNPLTAWALLDLVETKKDQWLILSAGSSTVSKLIVQFAQKRDIKTILLVRDLEHQNELLELGGTVVLKDDDEKLQENILKSVKDEVIAGYLDAVGGTLSSKVIKVLSSYSKVIHYGLFSTEEVSYHNSDVIFKNLTIQGFGIDSWISTKSKEEMSKIWQAIIEEIKDEEFVMEVAGKYTLEEYKKAILHSKNLKQGKILFYTK